jgi:hypothetical protein
MAGPSQPLAGAGIDEGRGKEREPEDHEGQIEHGENLSMAATARRLAPASTPTRRVAFGLKLAPAA